MLKVKKSTFTACSGMFMHHLQPHVDLSLGVVRLTLVTKSKYSKLFPLLLLQIRYLHPV